MEMHRDDLVDSDSLGFGYLLAPGARGRGRGRGIIPAVLASAMSTIGELDHRVHSCVAFCEDDNAASSRNLARAESRATSVEFVNSRGWRERLYERTVDMSSRADSRSGSSSRPPPGIESGSLSRHLSKCRTM